LRLSATKKSVPRPNPGPERRGEMGRLSWAEQEISAAAATVEQAGWLLIARGSPLIATTRLTYQDSATPVEYTRAWSRPEFPLVVRLDA
jgi:GntR family transcriptional regulator